LPRRRGEGVSARISPDAIDRRAGVASGSPTVGIMPAFADSQLSDQDGADLAAYFASLPKARGARQWRFEFPQEPRPGRRP